MLAAISEYQAHNKAQNENGPIKNRAAARAAIAEARADVIDMEEERKRRA